MSKRASMRPKLDNSAVAYSSPLPKTHLSIVERHQRYATRSITNDQFLKQDFQGLKVLNGLSIALLNPKILDSQGQLVLQAVLKLYSTELPAMSFAANTGKKSPFLEKCVTSGKYCTLLLKRPTSVGNEEVVAAISYQILRPDTQLAEIPLAAVSKRYQRKGLGTFLYKELQRRLEDVGIVSIFCWGDQESEIFWMKQGFLKVAEVDGRGKPRKLPIKTDVRRAMSIPGSAALMVSYLSGASTDRPINSMINDDALAVTPPRCTQPSLKQGLFEAALPTSGFEFSSVAKASPMLDITTPTINEMRLSGLVTPAIVPDDLDKVKLSGCKTMIPLNIAQALSSVADENITKGCPQILKIENKETAGQCDSSVLSYCIQDGGKGNLVIPEGDKENFCSKSVQRNSRKRERSQKSRTNKWRLIRARHQKFDDAFCNKDCADGLQNEIPMEVKCPAEGKSLQQEALTEVNSLSTEAENLQALTQSKPESLMQQCLQGETLEDVNAHDKRRPNIMFMNVADDDRRMQLVKFVEKLQGFVVSDGSTCTHVITGEVRRTLNFCTALNAGAWVVSPSWLKASVKENRFVDEAPFVLKDTVFESKYKVKLEDVIQRARQKPHGLLKGLSFYLTEHVHPPLATILPIIQSAGGKVLLSLQEMDDPTQTIVVACEEDVSEALAAAKIGLPTYTSEWLMSSIIKQDLDFSASQFAESL